MGSSAGNSTRGGVRPVCVRPGAVVRLDIWTKKRCIGPLLGALWGYFGQGPSQIASHLSEFAGGGHVFAPDQHIVPSRLTVVWQRKAGDFAQAAFGAVAGYGIANFFGTGEPHVNSRVIVVAIPSLKQKRFSALTPLVVAGKELFACLHGLDGLGHHANGNRRWRCTGNQWGALCRLRRLQN